MTFPKILLAVFLSVFQHYPWIPVAMVIDNLVGTFFPLLNFAYFHNF